MPALFRQMPVAAAAHLCESDPELMVDGRVRDAVLAYPLCALMREKLCVAPDVIVDLKALLKLVVFDSRMEAVCELVALLLALGLGVNACSGGDLTLLFSVCRRGALGAVNCCWRIPT
jgi:hypothetical protein